MMERSVRIEINEDSESIKDERTEENALDKYIYELYETDLKFQIEESEVRCIQTCVETLIKSIVVKTKRSRVYRKYVEKAVTVSTKTKTDKINMLKYMKDQFLNEAGNVLSVGSFYEGTRNTFPDEFDYIVVLAESPGKLLTFNWINRLYQTLLFDFCKALYHIANTCTNDFTHQDLQLHSLDRKSGPALKLKFIYKKELSGQHLIEVDLAPAVRQKIDERLRYVPDEQWNHRVLKTGTIVKMLFHERGEVTPRNGELRYSIIETEHFFMTTEVSFNHKLAYRFLKYILSRQNEEMQDLLFRRKTDSNWKKCDFSSYLVKTLLYQHVKKCSSDSSVGMCCIDMLLFLHGRFLTAEGDKCCIPYLKNVFGTEMQFCKDYRFAKLFEQVLKSYVLRLQEIRKQNDKSNHKLDFNPVTLLVTPYITQRLKSEFYWSFRKFLFLPVIFLSSLTIIILAALHERGVL